MNRKQLVFLAAKPIGYQCFEYLLSKREELNIDIAGLLTRRRKEFDGEHDLSALAAQHNIPLLASLDDIPECDIIYSIQHHEILKPQHIGKARQIAVNLHMAPLPEYRGCNQFSFAILDGKEEFGTTIHAIDPGVDHGDILFQKRFPVPEQCWVNDLYLRTHDASVKLFQQTLAHVISGNYNPVPQAMLEARFGTSTHYRKEIDTIKQISLDWPKEKIERHIRATSMPGFEPPFFFLDGKKMYFSASYS
jgi:methionyl-tRNA formyltransferase